VGFLDSKEKEEIKRSSLFKSLLFSFLKNKQKDLIEICAEKKKSFRSFYVFR
jgi:hypothetical protein